MGRKAFKTIEAGLKDAIAHILARIKLLSYSSPRLRTKRVSKEEIQEFLEELDNE